MILALQIIKLIVLKTPVFTEKPVVFSRKNGDTKNGGSRGLLERLIKNKDV
jgi:hypothetical protein